MRLFFLVIFMLAAGSVGGWFARDMSAKRIHAVRPFILDDKLSEPAPSFSAEGTWRGADLTNAVNTARIICDPAVRLCETIKANVVTRLDRSTVDLDAATYSITKLDDRSLVAEGLQKSDCIRDTIFVDRVAKRIQLVQTKVNQDAHCAGIQDAPLTLFLGDPAFRK